MSWSDIPGWFDFQTIYDEMVVLAQPGETIVEIGVGFGRSLAYLARRALDRGCTARIVGIDPFVDDWGTEKQTWGAEHAGWARALGGPYNAFVASMRDRASEELERVDVWRTKSVQASRAFDDGSCAGVFIDGSHFYDDVAADLIAWRSRVRPGGILAGHDYTEAFPGVVRAVDEAFGARVERHVSSWLVRV